MLVSIACLPAVSGNEATCLPQRFKQPKGRSSKLDSGGKLQLQKNKGSGL